MEQLGEGGKEKTKRMNQLSLKWQKLFRYTTESNYSSANGIIFFLHIILLLILNYCVDFLQKKNNNTELSVG